MGNASIRDTPEVWPLITFTNQCKQKDTVIVKIHEGTLGMGKRMIRKMGEEGVYITVCMSSCSLRSLRNPVT